MNIITLLQPSNFNVFLHCYLLNYSIITLQAIQSIKTNKDLKIIDYHHYIMHDDITKII